MAFTTFSAAHARTVPPHFSKARDAILQRRYAPAAWRPKPRATACIWVEDNGRMRMLSGWADGSKTRSGVLYNRRIRLAKRILLSAFKRREW